MTVHDLEVLYEYTWWANGKLLGVCAHLTDEQFTRRVAGSFGSLRETLVHTLSAEWGWLDRCGGRPRGARLVATDFPTVKSLADQWQLVEGYEREFLSRLRDDDLVASVNAAIGDAPRHLMRVGDLLHHVVIHGIHHRGQVALLLRELGVTPGNIDFLFYCAEKQKPE
jgi:uncharacterized damage-inducible protein DinB